MCWRCFTTRRILPQAAQRSLPPLPAPEGEHFGVAATDTPFAVRVRFLPSAAAYVAERRWSAGQTLSKQEDGSVILDFSARSAMEVVKWVLGFGREAELLAPEHLRERVRQELHDSLERYARASGASSSDHECAAQ